MNKTAVCVSVQISIELKRHPMSAWRKTAEDTWTLKIKHTPRQFETKWNDDDAYYNNELPSARLSATRKRSWHKIAGGMDTDVRRWGKARKGKSWRQLSPKSRIRRKHKETPTPTENKVTSLSANELPILKELFRGNERLRDTSNRINNDTRQVKNSDEAFGEADATSWGNIAAIMYDTTENHTMTVENKPDHEMDQHETTSTESNVDYKHDTLLEPYALPLQQLEDGKGSERDKAANSLDDTNKSETIHEYNSGMWKGSEDVDTNDYGGRTSRPTTERTDVADTSDTQQPTDTMPDYVIEDPTPREYDTEHVGNGEQEDEHGITDNWQQDFDPTAEMKRITNWFPRSRLLTTENNGYKLFPGVSEKYTICNTLGL